MLYAFSVAKKMDLVELDSYKKDISDKDSSKWIGTMKEEMGGLMKKQRLWVLIDKPVAQ